MNEHVGCFSCGKCITCNWCICRYVSMSKAHPVVEEAAGQSWWRPYEQVLPADEEEKDGPHLCGQ